jgi:hypothetical protein
MAIGRITGQMLFPNLERQGVDLQVDTDLVYFDVTTRRLGINKVSPQYTLDVNGNAQIGNLRIIGNTINSTTGKIGLGAINNLVVTGGQPNYIIYWRVIRRNVEQHPLGVDSRVIASIFV